MISYQFGAYDLLILAGCTIPSKLAEYGNPV